MLRGTIHSGLRALAACAALLSVDSATAVPVSVPMQVAPIEPSVIPEPEECWMELIGGAVQKCCAKRVAGQTDPTKWYSPYRNCSQVSKDFTDECKNNSKLGECKQVDISCGDGGHFVNMVQNPETGKYHLVDTTRGNSYLKPEDGFTDANNIPKDLACKIMNKPSGCDCSGSLTENPNHPANTDPKNCVATTQGGTTVDGNPPPKGSKPWDRSKSGCNECCDFLATDERDYGQTVCGVFWKDRPPGSSPLSITDSIVSAQRCYNWFADLVRWEADCKKACADYYAPTGSPG